MADVSGAVDSARRLASDLLSAKKDPDLNKATFPWEKFWAAVIIAGIVAIISVVGYAYRLYRVGKIKPGANSTLRRKTQREQRRGGFVMGADRRLSTSKGMATLWTLVVAYMVVAVAIIALSQHPAGSAFSSILKNTPALYLVFLGGPYAAAILSKASVINYTDNGQLQKSDGDGKIRPTDLINDDASNVNLYDFQYTLFNVIAVFAVLAIFLRSSGGSGFPAVPDFLAILTGGSALTYTVSKGANINSPGNTPTITSVAPPSSPINSDVVIYGSNFRPLMVDANGQLKPTMPTVQVGDYGTGNPAASSSDTRLVIQLPPLNNQVWPSGALPVKVITAAGLQATLPNALTVI